MRDTIRRAVELNRLIGLVGKTILVACLTLFYAGYFNLMLAVVLSITEAEEVSVGQLQTAVTAIALPMAVLTISIFAPRWRRSGVRRRRE